MTYASKAESFVVGGNYRVSQRTTLLATYTDVIAEGASATDYSSLTLGFEHQRSSRQRVSGEVTLGSFKDIAAADLNYDADLARLEWTWEQ